MSAPEAHELACWCEDCRALSTAPDRDDEDPPDPWAFLDESDMT